MKEDTEKHFECDCGTCTDCDIKYHTGYYPWEIKEMAEKLKGGDKVWIVWNTLKPEQEMTVFDNEDSAITHRKNMTKKWKLTKIVEREVNEI